MEEKKEKRVLWPNCPLQGRHGDWVGVRRMGLREMRKPNVHPAVCVICSKTFFFPGALLAPYSLELLKKQNKKYTSFIALNNFGWIGTLKNYQRFTSNFMTEAHF